MKASHSDGKVSSDTTNAVMLTIEVLQARSGLLLDIIHSTAPSGLGGPTVQGAHDQEETACSALPRGRETF